MGAIEIIGLLSYVPWVDLFSHGVNTESVPGFFYDIGQVVSGLHVMAKGIVAISEATPWEEDDRWAKKILGMTTSAVEFIARLGGALQKK